MKPEIIHFCTGLRQCLPTSDLRIVAMCTFSSEASHDCWGSALVLARSWFVFRLLRVDRDLVTPLFPASS